MLMVSGEQVDHVAEMIEAFARQADTGDRHFRDSTVDLACDLTEWLGFTLGMPETAEFLNNKQEIGR